VSGTKPSYLSTGQEILAVIQEVDSALLRLAERELSTSIDNLIVRNTLPTVDLGAAGDFASSATPYESSNNRWEEALTSSAYSGEETILDGEMDHDRFIGILGTTNYRADPATHFISWESGAQKIDNWQLQEANANSEDPGTLADEPLIYKKDRKVVVKVSSTVNGNVTDNLVFRSRVAEPAGERIAPGRSFN
jgi:hypothetical protein